MLNVSSRTASKSAPQHKRSPFFRFTSCGATIRAEQEEKQKDTSWSTHRPGPGAARNYCSTVGVRSSNFRRPFLPSFLLLLDLSFPVVTCSDLFRPLCATSITAEVLFLLSFLPVPVALGASYSRPSGAFQFLDLQLQLVLVLYFFSSLHPRHYTH